MISSFLKTLVFLILICMSMVSNAQKAFDLVPLGVYGGGKEDNLSAYLLRAQHTDEWICLDAGTIRKGLEVAFKKGSLRGNAAHFLKHDIKAYLISHGHLDHLAGMVINSPEDSAKNIYALPFCINVLKNNYFTWNSWANFANEGEKPQLNKYQYQYLKPNEKQEIAQTSLTVTAYELSHSQPGKSTAFLISDGEHYFLYLGDTGDDRIENSSKMEELWEHVAPLVKSKQLKGIAIEVSFPNAQPEKSLFGHLTPKLCYQNLNLLAQKAGENALLDLPVIVTHIKPIGNHEKIIKTEMKKGNTLGVKLLFPKQGKTLKL